MWCLHRNSRISLIILALLGGCGGGGDDSNPPPVNNRPVAEINASVTQGPAPLGVSFDGSQSSDPDGRIISYRWDFGDGSPPSSGQQVFHEYPDPGGYNVRLTVTDDDSATGTRTVNIQVQGASLSGSVNILSSSAVDADVNDRLTTPTANNDFATAQPIPNPVRLGGFVNLPGTGPSTGNLFSSGDTADFYAVSASGNEIVLLNIADPEANLELRLWDSQQNMVDATAGTGSTKSLTIDNPGSYFIEVFPASGASNPPGASNYVLSVGQDLSVAARPPNRVSDPFVPGELLLAAPVDRTAALQTGYDLRIQGRSGRFARARLGGRSRARILSRLGNGRGGDYGELPRHGRLTAALRARYETLLNVRDLSRDPELSQVEPNLMLRPSLEPDDEFYPLQWHYRAIKAPFAWDLTTGNENPVTIAVIDTGILPGHPDLGCQLLSGYDFIADPFRARDGDGIDPDPSDAGDLAFGSASSFHGTHVAGTVAACSNNGIGVAGVSWGARLMPLRALGVDGGTSYDVSQAIRYAAGLPSDAGAPPPPADIINLSLGSPFTSSLLADAVAAARAAGVILVASAGNQASSNPIYPAAYEGVISVAATTIENRLAPYSNFGAVDLAAPGGYNATDFNGDGFADGVVSLLGDDSSGGPLRLGYAALNGTSMAAPHVTGVIALMKSVHPGLSPAAFDLALAAGALTDDLGEPGRDPNYGHGLINAQKAVLEALAMASGGGTDPGPVLTSSLSSVDLGVLSPAEVITLANLGSGGDIALNPPVASENWLTISRLDAGNPADLGNYELRVDRAGLGEGSYSASARFIPTDPTVNTVTVSVTMRVAGTDPAADAGVLYVILVDEEFETVGPAAVVRAVDGRYQYRLADLPAGSYRLFAGSDMDDDGFLCDAGEACGAYPTLDAPEPVEVSLPEAPTMMELDFTAEFRAVVTTFQSAANQSSATGSAATPSPTQSGVGPVPAGVGIPYRKPGT